MGQGVAWPLAVLRRVVILIAVVVAVVLLLPSIVIGLIDGKGIE